MKKNEFSLKKLCLETVFIPFLALSACSDAIKSSDSPSSSCSIEFVVLGIGQDGGAPQIGNPSDPAWADPSLKMWAASGAVIDHERSQRVLFEATPDMREQLNYLDGISDGGDAPLGLSGVFLTHAHMGHYTGLMFAGHESIGANGLKVFPLPRMKSYLENNGPWDQLVRYKNIDLIPMIPDTPIILNDDLSVTAHLVPHRDEYSETAGYVIKGPSKSVLFLPDIDDWDRWESEYNIRIEDMMASVDMAFLDATFYDDNELPGRDMSKIPHPRVVDSMTRFEKLPRIEQEKVRFFHINHTNPIRDPESIQSRAVVDRGFQIASRGDRFCLD